MRSTKPNPTSTIKVTAVDMATGKSKTKTFYDTTPEECIEVLEREASIADAAAAAVQPPDSKEPT